MIKSSFVFLPKIKAAKEKAIWKQGIKIWDDFLKADMIKGISKSSKKAYDKLIILAKKALIDEDSSYFAKKLPSTETWRIYEYFKEDAIFLDIETSNASKSKSYLTVVGLFNGIDTKIMVKDVNLDIAVLRKELKNYKIMLTFNGSSFDLPYLNKAYPGLLPNVPHIDIRTLAGKAGLRGGLKEIEKELGIKRDYIDVEKIFSGDPIKLWKMYKGSGDRHYLELLVRYNEEDVINLKKIAEYSISKLKNNIITI